MQKKQVCRLKLKKFENYKLVFSQKINHALQYNKLQANFMFFDCDKWLYECFIFFRQKISF